MKKIVGFIIFLLSLVPMGFVCYLIFGSHQSIIEPREYGVFIREVHNSSDEPVTVINLLQNTYFVIKPGEQKKINSWLAASDYLEKSIFSSSFGASVTRKNGRSVVVWTKKGLFCLNLGRYHSYKTGDDLLARVWVLKETGDNQSAKPIKGWSRVEEIGSQDDGNRILLITQDGNLQMKLSSYPEKQEEVHEKIFSASDFFWYLDNVKKLKTYKHGYPV